MKRRVWMIFDRLFHMTLYIQIMRMHDRQYILNKVNIAELYQQSGKNNNVKLNKECYRSSPTITTNTPGQGRRGDHPASANIVKTPNGEDGGWRRGDDEGTKIITTSPTQTKV
jgi:hypothetical protein